MNTFTKTVLLPVLAIAWMTSCSPKGPAWSGTYKGVLPCGNCDGVETILSLNPDSTYTLNINYLGISGVTVPQGTGRFTWNEGNMIVLDKTLIAPAKYLLEGDKLYQLDADDKKTEGPDAPKYILTKQ
jgi:uncharacterized lipoprotein NlpE involved in copper resistance